MGHHFVPIYYLSGLTRDERLWVYDKATRKVFKSQPDGNAGIPAAGSSATVSTNDRGVAGNVSISLGCEGPQTLHSCCPDTEWTTQLQRKNYGACKALSS